MAQMFRKFNSYNIHKTFSYMKRFGFSYAFSKVKSSLIPSQNTNNSIYENWIKISEPTSNDLNNQKNYQFSYCPKISIIVPIFNPNFSFLKQMIESVLEQTYSNWELCIADGSIEHNSEIDLLLKKDSRIKYKYLNKNYGISGNSNKALEMVSGDYVSLLDYDDTLAPFALFEVVKCINNNPNVDFIYSDEDRITIDNSQRLIPNFKPDFSIDMLRSQNYICHFSIVKKSLLNSINCFNSDFDGSQDHDLFLRISERTNNIIHIPKILYHWRIVESSFSNSDTNLAIDSKGILAVKNHLNRLNYSANVTNGKFIHTYEVQYAVHGNPKVSIIIPNHNMYSTLKSCIDSILKLTTYNNYEIIIVENNSTDNKLLNYYKKLSAFPNINIVYCNQTSFNYSALINYGVKNCSGDYILQLNNDTKLLTSNWIEKMLGYAQRDDVGIVGVKLYFPNKAIQHAGVIINDCFGASHSFRSLYSSYNNYDNLARNVSAVTGACLMCSKKIFNSVYGMDENFAVNYNDIDFCMKVRSLGKLIVYTPFVEFIHYESKTRITNNELLVIEQNMFINKWNGLLKAGDPYYNDNFKNSPNYELSINQNISMPLDEPIAVIITNYNDYSVTKNYISTLNTYKTISKIIVVDNCSSDNSFEQLLQLKNEKIDIIQTPENIGYGPGNTYGIKYLLKQYPNKFNYVIISNPDIYVSENVIMNCFNYLISDSLIAIISPRIKNIFSKLDIRSSWKSRSYFLDLISTSCILRLLFYPLYKKGLYTKKDFSKSVLNVDCISGCFFVANINALKSVKFFDESIFLFYEEDTLCKKLKEKGYKICSLNTDFCIHFKSHTINKNLNIFKKRYLLNKSKLYYHKTYNNIGPFKIFLMHIVNGIRYIETIPEFVIRKLILLIKFSKSNKKTEHN